MAAGLVSHSITTAAGVTFGILSWVPDTAAPDVGAVPIARITDGTNVAPVSATTGLKVDVGALPVLPAGTNIIGKVDINSIPPLVAGTAHIGEVKIDPTQISALGQTTGSASVSVVPASDYGVPLATDKMFAGTTALTPKFATIAAASSGDNSVVASVSSKKIRVLALKITANGAVNAKWRSATTDITGLSYFAAAGDGEVLPFNPLGWFETAVTSALQVNLSGAVATGGHLTYIEV